HISLLGSLLFTYVRPPPPSSPLFPYTTLFRSVQHQALLAAVLGDQADAGADGLPRRVDLHRLAADLHSAAVALVGAEQPADKLRDRKSTRLTPVTFRSRMPSSA